MYYIYTVKKKTIVKQILCALGFISFMYVYWFVAEDVTVVINRVGLMSCAFTILFFASPLTLLVSFIITFCK
jgi:hypothetical protein